MGKVAPVSPQDDDLTEEARRVRAARAYADMTLDELAAAAGLGRMTIIRLENGTTPLGRKYLLTIADATGLPTEFFTEPYDRSSGAVDVAQRLDTIEQILRGLGEAVTELATDTAAAGEQPQAGRGNST
jgi:transcriptional regulator with XRE-family HTH domain